MSTASRLAWAIVLALPVAARAADQAALPDAFDRAPTLAAPPAADVKAQALAWLEGRRPGDAPRAEAAALWDRLGEDPGPAETLEALVATFALADPRAAELAARCAAPRGAPALPDASWLAAEDVTPLVRNNLRLVYGRWLVREELYDEALAELDALAPADVVDPASLLFFQAVAHHRLLRKEPGLKALRTLTEELVDPPHRYRTLAELMRADLEGLEDESLDHIARRMGDIERRLDLGHAGPRVREVEDGVIASLDKLIEKLEEQQKQQGGGASGSIRSTSPAQDSMPLGGRGPGETDRRDVGHTAGWGDLPPKERQEALQQIGKDFPAHYREIIEQYFRALASDESEPPSE
jgi:hypothetical protein